VLGPYSPKLTIPEKAALKAVEEGDVQGGTRRFLLASFSLVYQALEPHFDEIDLNAVLALREEEPAADLLAIRKLFWVEGDVTAWGELFLTWEEGEVEDSELSLSLDDLNDYLVRSTDFYEALTIDLDAESSRVFRSAKPGVEAQPVDVPVLNAEVIGEDLVVEEPPPEPDSDLPSKDAFATVIDDLTENDSGESVESDGSAFVGSSEQMVQASGATQEYQGTSWDTIKVETIYWPRQAPVGALDESALSEENIQEFEGTSWDSIKVETIYWDKSKIQTQQAVVPEQKPRETSVFAVQPGKPLFEESEPLEPAPEEPAELDQTQAAETARNEADDNEADDNEADGEELLFSRAPLDPFGSKNRLVVKNKYLGYGKNSQGVMGLCGQLKISYFKTDQLVGRLESSNPLLFLSSNRLSGKSSTITYWLPPVAFPHPAGHIDIRTPIESRTLSLNTLFPKSRTDLMRDRTVVLGLFMPALIGFLYFALVYIMTAHTIDLEAQQTFPRIYREAMAGLDTGDFRSQGLGLYRLRVVPASESLQMIWAAVVFLAPLLTSKFFYYLSRPRKRKFGGLLAAAQLAPTILLLLTWSYQDLVFPLYSHQDFAPLDLRGYLLWSVVMNILVAAYLFLSVFKVWDRKIKRPDIRFLLPLVLTGLYLLTMFIIIYGISWFS
jgi:hypothetical protein